MRTAQAVEHGWPADRRKRRRAHRRKAKYLLSNGGFFNNYSARGSSCWEVAQWHLACARYL